ncbi:MAG: hypothetical protein Fur0012_06270 [Elusimicrobiota bacterium]
MKKLFSALFIFFSIASAQENAFKVSVEKEVKLAVPFRIIIENLRGEPITAVSTESFKNADFELTRVARTGDNTLEIEAVPFALGISTFSPIEFSAGGEKRETPSIPIKILPYFEKTDGKIKEIYPPFFFMNPYKILFWLVLAAAAWFLAKRFLRKRAVSVQVISPNTDTRTPYEKAIDEIHFLEESAKKNFVSKDFYDSLSDIFRMYLSQRYSVQAPKMTTQDCIKALKERFSDFTILGRVRETLDIADLAKFARYSDSLESALNNSSAVSRLLSKLEEMILEEERKKAEGKEAEGKNAL